MEKDKIKEIINDDFLKKMIDSYRYYWKYIYVFQSEEVFKNCVWNPLEGGPFRIMT